MTSPILVVLNVLFCELVNDILDLVRSVNLGTADPEYVVDKAKEFIKVHGLFYCLLKRARCRRNVKNMFGPAGMMCYIIGFTLSLFRLSLL